MTLIKDGLVSSKNLADRISQIIGASVVSGELRPGTGFITEAEISEKYGISRNVAREAVKILSGKGLVYSRQKKGIQATDASSWNWFDEDILNWAINHSNQLSIQLELTELRLAIEPEASAMAAMDHSQEDLRLIESCVERLEGAIKNPQIFEQADIDFHLSIVDACQNRFYRKFSSILRRTLQVSVPYTHDINQATTFIQKAQEHKDVFLCIKRRQATEARMQMRAMLEKDLMRIKDQLNRQEIVA